MKVQWMFPPMTHSFKVQSSISIVWVSKKLKIAITVEKYPSTQKVS